MSHMRCSIKVRSMLYDAGFDQVCLTVAFITRWLFGFLPSSTDVFVCCLELSRTVLVKFTHAFSLPLSLVIRKLWLTSALEVVSWLGALQMHTFTLYKKTSYSTQLRYIYLKIFFVTVCSLLCVLVSWAWWEWPLTWLTNYMYCPSMLWHC